MVAVLQPLKNHKPIPIDRAVILVGRGEDCDVLITGSRKISRKHCCLVQSDQCFLIRDLGSTNGVWVNGKRVDQESEIVDGDRVAIADVQFRFFSNGVRQSDAQGQQSDCADGLNHHVDSVERIVPDNSRRHDDAEDIIEFPDDELLDDDLLDDRMMVDVDAGPVDSTDMTTDDSEPPPPRSKGKGRPFHHVNKPKPVIDLDDSFVDQEIEDIIIFDDE